MTSKLFEAFERAGHELFFVGGFVRDKLRGVESDDIDFATSARPEDTMLILKRAGLKAIPIGIEFGTVQTEMNGEKVEITTFRCQESFKKGSRHPSVKFGDTIEQDLVRRDFTFNAIAMRECGTIIDPFNGARDLEDGVINTPQDPNVIFRDDPLRMLRAARFEARGIGEVNGPLFCAMRDLKAEVHNLSGERVFEELTKLLMSAKPSKGLQLLQNTGILGELFPELEVMAQFDDVSQGRFHHLGVFGHTMAVVDAAVKVPEVLFAALFHDVSKPDTFSVNSTGPHFFGHAKKGADKFREICDRRVMVVPNKLKENVALLIDKHQALVPTMGDKGLRRLIVKMGLDDQLTNLFLLRRADIAGQNPDLMVDSLKGLTSLNKRIFSIEIQGGVPAKLPSGTGNLLMEAFSLKGGPELGRLMKGLTQMLIDGELTLDSDFVGAAQQMLQQQ